MQQWKRTVYYVAVLMVSFWGSAAAAVHTVVLHPAHSFGTSGIMGDPSDVDTILPILSAPAIDVSS